MELWIRSQNRSQLTKITGLLLLDKEIRGFTNTEYFYELGIYKTEERALEVLDEIQKLLMPIAEYKLESPALTIKYENIDKIVYEMPKE